MFDSTALLQRRFAALRTYAEFFSLRHVRQSSQHLAVRKNIAEPPSLSSDEGVMITVRVNGVEAYAATGNLSQTGLQQALERAESQARGISAHALLDLREQPVADARFDYLSPDLQQPFPNLADCYQLLADESARVPDDPRLVSWYAGLGITDVEQIYLNNAGAQIRQAQRFVFPGLSVTAFDGSDSQTRSLGRDNFGQQGGVDVIERCGIVGAGRQVADQALQLLLAPNAPQGPRDLLLTPDQMMLQIHESIGHPLELDRILGDERNYAGTSFVKVEDFGHLRYGSPLLNVTFDPDIPHELASYAHDDDGTPASKQWLIRDGVLVRRMQALETLSHVATVVFDKTGTLTRDAFVLEDLRLRDGVSRAQALALAAALARDSLHPVSRALVDAARAEGSGSSGETPVLAALEEVAGQGVKARLANGHEVRLGSAAFCGVPVTNGSGPSSHLSDGQGWLASFHFREDARDDAQASVAALKDDGVKVRLLSGDRHDAAARLGALVGIDDARGGCLPDDKLALMQQAQAEGATVAMVGDGLNDGPVLAGANVSFAFGRSMPLARAQADFVVLGDRLSLIPACHAKARRTMQIVRQNLGWAAAYNAIGVPLAMMGWVSAWLAGLGMAASSLLVVVNALRLSSDEQRPDEVH